MSHQICYRDIAENEDKKKTEASIDELVARRTAEEGGHGLPHPIRWLNNVAVQEDYAAAEKKISELDKGWYDCLAIRFRALPKELTNVQQKRLDELKYRRRAALKKYEEEDKRFYFADSKSKFVSCPCCGSKLNIEKLGELYSPNSCPLCKTDLRPKTALDKIASLKQRFARMGEQIENEQRKILDSNGEVRWLIKYEYHV